MGSYDPRLIKKELKRETHPIWRGIGCLLMIIIPLISIAAADIFINSNLNVIAIPNVLRRSVDTGIFGVIRFFPAKLLLGLVIAVGLFAVSSVAYSILYSLTGGKKRGPMDAPPVRKRVKKRDL